MGQTRPPLTELVEREWWPTQRDELRDGLAIAGNRQALAALCPLDGLTAVISQVPYRYVRHHLMYHA